MRTLLLLCLGLLSGAWAQVNWSPATLDDVPEPAQKEVERLHPNAKHISWGMRYKGKTILYHATGMEDGHHFSAKLDKDGNLVGKIRSVQHHEVPEAVTNKIKEEEAEGWTFVKAYHTMHKGDDYYKAFFTNKDGKHLKVAWKADGNQYQRHQHKQKHGHHHVIDR